MRDERPHDPSDLEQVGPPLIVARRIFPLEMGSVDAGLVFPFWSELFRHEELWFAVDAELPHVQPAKVGKKSHTSQRLLRVARFFLFLEIDLLRVQLCVFHVLGKTQIRHLEAGDKLVRTSQQPIVSNECCAYVILDFSTQKEEEKRKEKGTFVCLLIGSIPN